MNSDNQHYDDFDANTMNNSSAYYTNSNSNNQSTNDSSSDAFIYTVNENDGKMTLLIEEEPILMIIDSGASINIINTETANKLKQRGLEFTKCQKIIQPYGSPALTAKNKVQAPIQIAGHDNVINAEFYVIHGDSPPLLSKTTAEALGVLHIGLNYVNTANELSAYPGITDGIGKLKDFDVQLHIDKSVSPVARKHSRVPFLLRPQVEKELERLENQDIIEKVSGPTLWVSRIVAAPKPKKKNEIRICVDMCEANKAIFRTRYVTPTISN